MFDAIKKLKLLDWYTLLVGLKLGKNKAKVFESALGFNESHASQLIKQIISALPTGTTILGQVKAGSNIPELTTLFVK